MRPARRLTIPMALVIAASCGAPSPQADVATQDATVADASNDAAADATDRAIGFDCPLTNDPGYPCDPCCQAVILADGAYDYYADGAPVCLC